LPPLPLTGLVPFAAAGSLLRTFFTRRPFLRNLGIGAPFLRRLARAFLRIARAFATFLFAFAVRPRLRPRLTFRRPRDFRERLLLLAPLPLLILPPLPLTGLVPFAAAGSLLRTFFTRRPFLRNLGIGFPRLRRLARAFLRITRAFATFLFAFVVRPRLRPRDLRPKDLRPRDLRPKDLRPRLTFPRPLPLLIISLAMRRPSRWPAARPAFIAAFWTLP